MDEAHVVFHHAKICHDSRQQGSACCAGLAFAGWEGLGGKCRMPGLDEWNSTSESSPGACTHMILKKAPGAFV